MVSDQESRGGTVSSGFAEQLSGLKERSGRSYGALARQLHMSTSTLHRYCNGDAVPTDYAPVERLARLCRATPDELVELHRQWILADAARGRGKAVAAGSAGSAASTEPMEPAGSAEPVESAGCAGSAEPAATATSDQAPAPHEAVDASEFAALPAGRARAADGTAGAADAEDTGKAAGTAHSGLVVVGRTAVTRKRARRIAIATAAACALAVSGAVAAGQLQDEGGKEQDSAAKRQPAGAVAESPAGKPSASRSASAAPSGSASPGAKKRGSSPSGRQGADAGTGSGPTSGKESGGYAPSVGISSYNWAAPCDEIYVLDEDPKYVAPPPAPQEFQTWARSQKAAPAGHLRLQLSVTGNSDKSVVIDSLNVRVVGRKTPPVDSKVYSMAFGCGSGITPQTFDIDLDDRGPVAAPVAGQDGDKVVPAKAFPYKVSTSDPQVLNLDVHTEENDVEWYLELGWNRGAQKEKLIIKDEGGRPFRTNAISGRKVYEYWPDKQEWIAQ
ncbi:helix-turn-helix domain-containing protein [Streptomyces sp. NPDC059828]|uniref:helix-turn-helix domain-containing protein n=1 Tax=Streptomyces sp. NPDC059828 TaxID=3346965 RepID=UPI003655F6F7